MPEASCEKGPPRFQRPDRNQVELRPSDLDGLLSPDHRARSVWEFVEHLDLGGLYDAIDAVEGGPGRPPIDPRILTALWLYATVDGVGSARHVDRLCQEDDAYRWICGGVSVNYHTLADFRVEHGAVLDRLLTESVAALMEAGLVDIERVAQDGVRVRANAGAGSFRREETLQQLLQEAEDHIRALRKEVADDSAKSSKRHQAARKKAAEERSARVKSALKNLPEIAAKKKPKDQPNARASTTDPDARVMKMGDGGFRPAVNVQFATDTKSQVIVGVDVTNSGSDAGQMSPMIDQIDDRFGKKPAEMLVDGGYPSKQEIDLVSAGGTTVYAPVMEPKDETRHRHAPLPEDSTHVAEWRVRMGTPEAKAIYKERAATAECVNACARNRGLQRLLVRGLQKAKAVATWFALAHDMMRALSLQVAVAASGG